MLSRSPSSCLASATTAQQQLMESLHAFRSTIKNDLSSISASGERIRDEARKISVGVDAAIKQMAGPEMRAAVENAERLVVALQSIHDLKSTRLAFAVMGEEAPKTPTS